MGRRERPIPPSPDFAPVRMDEVELGTPLSSLPGGAGRDGTAFAASLCLVRQHGRPLGLVEVPLTADGISAEELAGAIGAALGAEADAHQRADGLPPAEITAEGLAAPEEPACVASREAGLSHAPSLSVVICTRNRPDSVRETLASIIACRYPAERWEGIVVDNASEADPSIVAAAAEAAKSVPVRVVHEPVPGLSNARNRGLRDATGEIVVFADDDVAVDRDWLALLAAPFADERVGATSGMTLPGSLETPVERWTEGFGGRSRPLTVRRFDLADPPHDNPLFPFTVGELGAGRNMAFRRDLLEQLGGFDPALGPGTIAHDGDDIEALLRVLLADRAIVHDPAAIVWHAHPDDYGELEDRVWGYGIGLTACLTKAILDRPSLLLLLLRKLPRGVAFAISPNSEKNVGRQGDFPRSLVRRELAGMAYGPIAYLRSRRRHRRHTRTAPVPPEGARDESHHRILIVSDEYRPVIGGAGRNIELLARQLVARGHSVAVATAWQPEAASEEDDAGVQVYRVRDLTSRAPGLSDDPNRHHAPPYPDPEAVAGLRRVLKTFEPDVVHAYGWLSASAAAALAGSRTPLLVSMHDYGNVCPIFTLVRNGEACSGPGVVKCLSCASSTYGAAKASVAVASLWGARPLLRRKVDAVHGVSHYVAEMTSKNLRLPGVEPVVIPNFIDPDAAEPIDESLLEKLPAEPFILFVGHLRPYKGVEVLLSAYATLEAPPPLVMVGTIANDSPSEFPPGVEVFTYVPHGTVMAMWERSLFGVSPSIAPEALPSVVLEAMTKGKPMVASRIAGYPDMVDDGETGLLVTPGSVPELAAAMARLTSDGELRARLGETAAERVGRFSPDAVVPRVERLYMDAILTARAP
jgi:glycosyltransferase involved in cell wall biosynthesis